MYADIGIMLILIGVAFAGSDCLTAHNVTAFESSLNQVFIVWYYKLQRQHNCN
jgi:hypothetical protein